MLNKLKPIKNDIFCELASRDFWWYCKVKAPDFYKEDRAYLKAICTELQEFENNDTELLVINIPPRHGKSRTGGLFVEWLLGRDNNYKIITASYNEKLSRRFSKSARDSISEQRAAGGRIVYSDIFPNTKIARGSAQVDLWRTENSEEDNYLATAPKATVTGFGGDFIIIDDLIKNAYEANNRNILDEHYTWFTDTMYSRLEGKRKLLLIMTRWATKDLAGRVIDLYKEQKRKVKVITKKAYNNGQMLNDEILSKPQYDLLMQTVGEDIVRANYDQQPVDLKGVLYKTLLTYDETPQFTSIEARCDTADKGNDYLCLIIYGVSADGRAYVLDVYYTKDDMDITEHEIARRLTEFEVDRILLESNFGGRAFAKVISERVKEMGNTHTAVMPFTQTENKEARILSNATNVQRRIYFPKDWRQLWSTFYMHVTEYQRVGINAYDDAPDTLTMIAEGLKPKRQSLFKQLNSM